MHNAFRATLWNIDCDAHVAIFRLVDTPPEQFSDIITMDDFHALPSAQGSQNVQKETQQAIFGIAYPGENYTLTSEQGRTDRAKMEDAEEKALFDDAVKYKGNLYTLHDFIQDQYVQEVLPRQEDFKALTSVEQEVRSSTLIASDKAKDHVQKSRFHDIYFPFEKSLAAGLMYEGEPSASGVKHPRALACLKEERNTKNPHVVVKRYGMSSWHGCSGGMVGMVEQVVGMNQEDSKGMKPVVVGLSKLEEIADYLQHHPQPQEDDC